MNRFLSTKLEALKSPSFTMSKIRDSSLEELKQIRREANSIEYKSLEAMELVINEYVEAEPVWHQFREWAIDYDFEDIFTDMIYILHFIYDVRLYKEKNEGKLFIYEAQKRPQLMEKVNKVLGDGIQKFLDYTIELKEQEPQMLQDLISDYELSSQIQRDALSAEETA